MKLLFLVSHLWALGNIFSGSPFKSLSAGLGIDNHIAFIFLQTFLHTFLYCPLLLVFSLNLFSFSIVFKRSELCGLEQWLDLRALLLLFQRTSIRFPAPIWQLTMFPTPVSGTLIAFSASMGIGHTSCT